MKLLLVDDQERLVFDGNVDIKNFHIKVNEPDYDEHRSLMVVPVGRQTYKLDFKADFEIKDNVAFRVYPERLKESDIEIGSCFTRGKVKCVHEQQEFHDKFCTDWTCCC
jgi:hypothetical protein